MKYLSDLDKAQNNQDSIHTAFKKMKRKKPKNLDDTFHELHDEVFEEIDCLECANCCKTTSPIFRDIDIKRIAKKLKIYESEFEQRYLRKDEDGDWVLKSSPCHFLMNDNTCSIYEIRPQACREYPHTNRKRMVQVLDLTERNALICPAVSRIVLKLVEKQG